MFKNGEFTKKKKKKKKKCDSKNVLHVIGGFIDKSGLQFTKSGDGSKGSSTHDAWRHACWAKLSGPQMRVSIVMGVPQ